MLGLGHSHAVSGDHHHKTGLLHHLCRAFGRFALDRLTLGTGRLRLDLSEGAKKDVREGAVHGAAHNDREDETGGTVQRSRGDQQFVVENEAHRDGRQARIRIQQ